MNVDVKIPRFKIEILFTLRIKSANLLMQFWALVMTQLAKQLLPRSENPVLNPAMGNCHLTWNY